VALKLITPHTDKVTRFLEHESDFNKWNIMFCPGTERLIDQLESFPNGSHDDWVDAMVYSFVKPKYDASLMTWSRREEEDEDDDDD
jgi:predicted phage terminase large subunit-like protein